MTATAANITVPARAHVYLAPKGTAAPADATTALATAWKDVGYFTTDSLDVTSDPKFEDVNSAQSDFPVRKFQTSDGGKISVDLQEWSTASFVAVYGGGTVTVASGVSVFTPPVVGTRQEVSAIIEIIDNAKHYRFIYPRVFQEEGVPLSLHKSKEATLALRLSILASDGVAPFTMITDDPSFVAST